MIVACVDRFDVRENINAFALLARQNNTMIIPSNVSDVAGMRKLRDRLHALGIGLAYDDFGAGQSRLAELAEAPPDFLKLDMKLMRGIDQAPARQEIVGALTEISSRLGVRVLAEGIETIEEAECCRRLGCHWAQGFLFGRPAPSGTFPTSGLPKP